MEPSTSPPLSPGLIFEAEESLASLTSNDAATFPSLTSASSSMQILASMFNQTIDSGDSVMMRLYTENGTLDEASMTSGGTGATTTNPSGNSDTANMMRFIKIGLLAVMFILIFCGNSFVLVSLNVSVFDSNTHIN